MKATNQEHRYWYTANLTTIRGYGSFHSGWCFGTDARAALTSARKWLTSDHPSTAKIAQYVLDGDITLDHCNTCSCREGKQ